MHLDQICEVSTFFKAAFNSQFREGSEKTMDLPKDDVNTVDQFIQWLYTRRYKVEKSEALTEKKAGDFLKPIHLLIFADKYDVPSLKCDVLNGMLDWIQNEKNVANLPPSPTAVKHLYHNTCRNSGLRRLMTDWYAASVTVDWLEESSVQKWFLGLPEFAVDLVIALARVRDKSKQWSFKHQSWECYLELTPTESHEQS